MAAIGARGAREFFTIATRRAAAPADASYMRPRTALVVTNIGVNGMAGGKGGDGGNGGGAGGSGGASTCESHSSVQPDP